VWFYRHNNNTFSVEVPTKDDLSTFASSFSGLNTMIFTKNRSLAIAGVTSILFLSSVGSSNAIGLTILSPSNFTLDTSTPSGVFDPAASPIGNLDTIFFDTTDRTQAAQALLGGFEDFFTTGNFLAVGGLGTQAIGSSTRAINTRVNSIGFTLSTGDFTQDLLITFDFAFAGYLGRNAKSLFSVQLSDGSVAVDFIVPIELNNGVDNGAGQPILANGKFQSAFSTNATGIITAADLQANFTAGNTFFVSINLNEDSSRPTSNTAAGFQNISVESIPFDFEPSLGIGLLGLGFGLNKVRKNWKAKKSIEV